MSEELKIIISAQVEKLKQNVDKAKKDINSFKEQVAKASKEVESKFKSIGDAMANGAKVAATGLMAAGAALLALGASTQEYRQQQAMLATAFENAGSNAAQASQTYNDLYRVLGDGGAATEAAQQLAQITTEEKALADYTTILQGVYATWGESISQPGLAEAINHTIELGSVQGTLADALEWSGITVEDYNKKLEACNSEAEREALIRETLGSLYNDAAAQYEVNNAAVLAQNEAQASLAETMAYLGEIVAPVITAFTNFASQALDACIPYISDLAENLLPILSEALDAVVYGLESAFGWIEQNRAVLAVMAGIITGIAAAITLYNTVAAVKAAMAALEVTSVWGLVAAYTAQAAAMVVAIAPYVLVVAGIAAVIAIIVLCVKHWDKIVAAVKSAVGAIVDFVKGLAESIANWFNNIISKAQQLVENIRSKFEQIKAAISEKIQAAKEKALAIFTNIKEGIAQRINAVKTNVANIFNNIRSAITEKIQAAKQSVLNIFDGIKSGIQQKIEAAKNIVSNIINAIKGFFSFKITWPHIPMPHFGLSPAGWKIGDLLKGSIPKLKIDWYAEGGVFDKPTLFNYGNGALGGLGEAGAEAVVPLENNTKWMNILADKLSERMGGSTPIVLNVDGKVFAQTAINTINSNTRQTGKLALNLI